MFTFTEKYDGVQRRIITIEQILIGGKRLISNVSSQWDCGATQSSISSELAEELNLKPFTSQNVDSTSGTDISKIYDIDYVVRSSNRTIQVYASEAKDLRRRGNIDLLIGMDVISLGDFAISNYKGKTYFSFRYPSQGSIDFTKM